MLTKLKTLSVLLLAATPIIAHHCESNSQAEECRTDQPGQSKSLNQDTEWEKATSIYDFHARDIHGNDVPLSKYRGHVAIIVNVASQCGLTDTNYKHLVQLYEKYSESKGLRILAFPSNQFGGQEPGTSQEILDFVKRYNVTFDMFEKVDVNGDNAHPLWKWLETQASGFLTNDIKWNFTKFIINKQGKVVDRAAPQTDPLSLESELEKLF